MTLAELAHGRGTQASAHEVSVIWPAFFAARARLAEYHSKSDDDERVGA